MNILLLGATGFIGRHLADAFLAGGHSLVPWRQDGQRTDMAALRHADDWMPWLENADAVVNAVGVLRDTAIKPMWALHADAPVALFEACARRGVQRVIQISALGIAQGQTQYARSKRTADAALMQLVECSALNAVIVRPSIVVGQGGASTALFSMLSRLPWLPLPQQVAVGQVQPMHVQDLANACVRLLDGCGDVRGLVHAVGPEVFSVESLIAAWRAGAGRPPARVWRLPPSLSRWSARCGDAIPRTPWGSETLELLAQPNVGPVEPWAKVLGAFPRSVRSGAWQAGGHHAQAV